MRFLNGYEIPYQAEDFFEVPGTSVQVSDKKFISIILCGNIADGSNYKQADHILSQMWKNNDKNSKIQYRSWCWTKNYLKDQTHVYKTGGCVDRAENGVSYIFFSILFHKNFISIAKDLV